MYEAIAAFLGLLIGVFSATLIKGFVKKEADLFYSDLHIALLDEVHEIHSAMEALRSAVVKKHVSPKK